MRSVRFLTQKWERELDYALRKDLWTFVGEPDRGSISVRVAGSPTVSGGVPTATRTGSSTTTA